MTEKYRALGYVPTITIFDGAVRKILNAVDPNPPGEVVQAVIEGEVLGVKVARRVAAAHG